MKKTFIIAALSVANILSAQTTTTSPAAGGSASVAQAKLQAFMSSINDFAAQDFTDGETALERANDQPAGTPSWDKESAVELIKMAHYFGNAGNPTLAVGIAKLALGHLVRADQAYTSANVPGEVANEKELQGNLYEHYFENRSTAEKFYAAAISLSPNTTILAAAALQRLQQIDASEIQKQGYAASLQ